MQCGQFPAPHFMENFPRLRIGEWIGRCRLVGRQAAQDAARDARIEPQHFQRSDQSIAPEGSGIPGNSRIGIGPLRRIGHQHVKIGNRTTQNLIEDVVRGLNGGCLLGGDLQIALGHEQPAEKAKRLGTLWACRRKPQRKWTCAPLAQGSAGRGPWPARTAWDQDQILSRCAASCRRSPEYLSTTS